jgi:hypothetical protein
MDLSKLTDEQLDVAQQVIAEAKKQGINPDFILPLVMQESGFNQGVVSKKGATGVMQLMPDTAKSLGVDPNDQSQNIKGGVSFIKQLLTHENIQGDPYKVLMGYNAGPNSKFFHTGDIKDLPDETLNYADKIRELSGGVLPSASFESSPSTSVVTPTVPSPVPANSKTTEAAPPPSLNPLIGAGAGAFAGTAAGTSAASYKAHVDAAQAAYDYAQAQRAAKVGASSVPAASASSAQTAPSVIQTDLTPTDAQHTRAFEGTQKGQGVTGRASQTTYNLRTQQIAEQAKEKARVIADLQRRGILPKTAPSLPGNVAATSAGIITTPEAVQALNAATQEIAPAAEKTSSFWKYLRGLGSLPVKAALGGAGAGFGAIDALNRHNAKDDTGAAISGLGTLAGLAAPYVASAGALPAASIAAPLYLMGSDRIEHLKKHPEDVRLQEDRFDPLGMPIR